MINFYTIAYGTLGFLTTREELSFLENRAMKENEWTVYLALFLDWISVIAFFPILLIIRFFYNREYFAIAKIFTGIFRTVKVFFVFIPMLVLMALKRWGN